MGLPQVLEYAENIINLVYPVGSIYMSVNNVSPATFIGGTWEQLKDRFLLGAGSSYSAGSTGGAATHTLTTAQMPSHTHTTDSQGAHTHSRGSMEISGSILGNDYALFGAANTTESGALYTTGGGYTSAGTSQGSAYKKKYLLKKRAAAAVDCSVYCAAAPLICITLSIFSYRTFSEARKMDVKICRFLL